MKLALTAPRATLVVCILIFGVFAAGLPRLALSSDTRIYFSETNIQLDQLRGFERKFSQKNNVLFAVKSKDGKITTPAGLQVLAKLTEQAWQLPLSTRVESLTNFPRIVADEESFSIENLVSDAGRLTVADGENVARIALEDPLVQGRLISPDATAGGVFVSFNLPPEASEEVRQVNAAVRELRAEFADAHPQFDIFITGNVMLMGAFAEAATLDIKALVPLSMSLIVLLLIYFVRSTVSVLSIMSLLTLSSSMAMGIAGWWGHVINPSTAAAPIVIMTVNMAAAVHVVTITMRAMAEGMSKAEAILYSLKSNILPITLTSATTMVGFLAMNMAESPPLYTLGNIVAVGILIAYLLTFTWLPAMLYLLPLKAGAQGASQVMSGLGRFVNNNHRFLILLMIGVCGISVLGLSKIHLDDDFIRYFDERFEFRRGADFVEDNLTGVNLIEFDLKSDSDGGIYHPDYQRTIDAFAVWLRSQEGVVSVISISEITKRIHTAMVQPKQGEAFAPIPDSADLISQYFLLYELSLPFGSEINDQINVARTSSRLTVIAQKMTSSQIRDLNLKAQAWLTAHAPASMVTPGISINVLFSHLSVDNMRSMISSLGISIVIIGIIIVVALRSWTLGLLSLGTNLLPAVIGFGAWGFLFQDIGLAASVIAAMTLGIVVDDTIHFLTKYRSARGRGLSVDKAVEDVFSTVGVAMLVTTVSMVVGFSALVLSGFEINRVLGIQTAIIILAALLVDWFLLPPILHLLKNGGVPAGAAAEEQRERR